MFSFISGLIQGLAGIFIGLFKTDKPKKETIEHVQRKSDLVDSDEPPTPL